MPHGGTLEMLRVVGRDEDIARTVPFMSDVSFFLQESQHTPDRRVTRLIGEVGKDFGGGRTLSPDEDVHYLSFATTQLRERLGHIYGIVLVCQHGAHTLASVALAVKQFFRAR